MKLSLVEFSVKNFRIFQEKVTFSMLSQENNNVFNIKGKNLLKTSLIYGPNASGKSSLLWAIALLRKMTLRSINIQEGFGLPYRPFLLSANSGKNDPTFLEIIFFLDKRLFQYNFSFSQREILTENLLELSPSGKKEETPLLIRKKQNINLFAEFKKSKDIIGKTRKGVLFLSAVAQWNNKLGMQIIGSFEQLNVIKGYESDPYRGYTINLFEKAGNEKTKIIRFLKQADFCIESGVVKKMGIPKKITKAKAILEEIDTPAPATASTVYFTHNIFDSQGNKAGTADFNIGDESEGTQRFFDLLGPVIDTLEHGKVLFIDEFDNSIHPYLTRFLINLFEKKNPKNAQLVATTHDTSLLSNKELNDEQFWFTEKDKFGAGNLFSLAEFKQQNKETLPAKYLEGRFGAVPFIS